ncbi:hypothetical protein EV182_003141 [Spiromyces aspiralis]|uniref:Uncharacterized protein n=1 Tax=Spiromyces aspiralis TaxID=68401 RepID=A0ACC1HE99_9FUNG|nr:hypothetical protein EV182_003141 [Spiromyces aspiralis]
MYLLRQFEELMRIASSNADRNKSLAANRRVEKQRELDRRRREEQKHQERIRRELALREQRRRQSDFEEMRARAISRLAVPAEKPPFSQDRPLPGVPPAKKNINGKNGTRMPAKASAGAEVLGIDLPGKMPVSRKRLESLQAGRPSAPALAASTVSYNELLNMADKTSTTQPQKRLRDCETGITEYPTKGSPADNPAAEAPWRYVLPYACTYD